MSEITRQQLKEFNQKDYPSVAARYAKAAEKMLEQKEDLVSEASQQLNEGRDYLMSVDPDRLTVEDCLEAFGFGRNGLGR